MWLYNSKIEEDKEPLDEMDWVSLFDSKSTFRGLFNAKAIPEEEIVVVLLNT